MPSLLEQLEAYARQVKGAGEVGASMLSGVAAEPIAGLRGLLSLAEGEGVAAGAGNVERTRDKLTYAPRSPEGQQQMRALGNLMAPLLGAVEKGKRTLGDGALKATGSPGLAAAAYTAPDAILAALGARPAMAAANAGMRRVGPPLKAMANRSAGPVMGSPVSQIGAIRAYHGSPHDFDRFSMDHIGTGEGNQAYGHGLYFSGDETVARVYQNKVPAMQGKSATVDGRPINWDDPREAAAFELMRHGGDREAAASFYEATFKGNGEVPSLIRNANDLPAVQPAGRLYDVELAPDDADLLDWDAPLAKQPQRVQEALNKAGIPGLMDEWAHKGMDTTGGELLQNYLHILTRRNGVEGPHAGEKYLRDAGIPGIRYLDGGSRAAGDGPRNYVMFDDSLIKVLSKK